jgi:hypothetical protein
MVEGARALTAAGLLPQLDRHRDTVTTPGGGISKPSK